jgi:uncharacterized protein YfiM (DUF2279 family)
MFLLRFFALLLLFALLGMVALPVIFVYQGLQPQPLVPPIASPRQEDVGRIKALLLEHDPRDLRDGETRTLTVSERDLNVGLRSVLSPSGRQRARVYLDRGSGRLQYTFKLPANLSDSYLNLSLLVREQGGEPVLDRVLVGESSLPGWSLAPLLALSDRYLKGRFPEYQGAREALQAISLGSGEASFTYRWDRALAKQIEQRGREVFLPAADRERALAYYRVLSRTSRSAGRSASLQELLRPLFSEARTRSTDGDAAAENRALLLVLGTVLNRSSMHRLVGGDPADLSPGHYYVKWTLHGRGDLAQHFGVSAAIAAAGGGVLADSIGVFKELDDSRGGSGFSFPDLLADRAGVELSTAALGADARRIQQAMASDTLSETDFMPPIDALPEGLMEMEFKQRYRDLDDARYGFVKNDIEQRLALLPIYH